MDISRPSTNQARPKYRARQGFFYQLQMVVGVAIVLATLFTAWTPPGLLPGNLANPISQALLPAASSPQAELLTTTPRPSLRIGIVSGHWGNDSGAVCDDGLTEADVNLNIATKVKENLVGQGYVVDLLKEFDPRLDEYHAVALVSIHADSCQYINDEATGFKVSAAMSTLFPEKAARLTACIRNRYEAATGLPFHVGSVTPDMTSYHAFKEINSDTTAAIIEVGFLNLDRQVLTQDADRVVSGVVNGILCYVRNEDISSNSPANDTATAPP